MRIAILAYDGISPFMLSTPIAVFGEPFLASGHTVQVCAPSPGISASGGLRIATPHALDCARAANIVILPGWSNPDEPVPRNIVTELRAANARGAIVVGLCLGAFGLAEAGLLDGRRATTHWARIQEFASRYPRVNVNPGAIFVDEGTVLTSAGVAAGLDCCLHILARTAGAAAANRTARHLVVAPQRAGEEPQLIDTPVIGSATGQRVAAILASLRADPAHAPTLDELARRAGMSKRSLTRHIRTRTGGSLGAWLRRARMARAQQLLLDGVNSFERIAERSGFPDAQAMRTAFRIEFGMTPRQWLARHRLDLSAPPADAVRSARASFHSLPPDS